MMVKNFFCNKLKFSFIIPSVLILILCTVLIVVNIGNTYAYGEYKITYYTNKTDVFRTDDLISPYFVISEQPQKEGYNFLGWSTNFNATTVDYRAGALIEGSTTDIDLYAVWSSKGYKIVYYYEDDDGNVKQFFTDYGYAPYPVISDKPEREDYNFLGWSTNSNASTVEYQSGGVIDVFSDTDLYAVWEPKAYIIFNRAEGTERLLTCDLDENNKISSSCVSEISEICGRWSLEKWDEESSPSSQSNQIQSANFANMNFNYLDKYYCVAGSSIHEEPEEPVEPEEPEDPIVPEEPKEACYVCKADNNIMKWSSDGNGDTACSGGYDITDKVESECVTIIPEEPEEPKEACYVCKADNNIMKWSSDGNGDTACSGGYDITDKIESECVTIIPEEPEKPEEPKEPENPKTADILIYAVWTIGIGALGYSVYYFMKRKNSF